MADPLSFLKKIYRYIKLHRNLPKIREREQKLQEYKNKTRHHAKDLHRLRPIPAYMKLAFNIEEKAEECKADLYVAHGVQALPAAEHIKSITGGQSCCDVIEIPSFQKRILPVNWDPTISKLIEYGLEGFLRNADHLTTVGWSLKGEISHLNQTINVIPNYKHLEPVVQNTALRDCFNIPQEKKIILCLSTVTTGLEAVLNAFTQLDDDVVFIIIGHIKPSEYHEKILALIDELSLQKRVFFQDPIAYNELNNYISLPNRVFDYISAHLPFVAPYMPDIDQVIQENSCGITIKGIESNDWLEGIKQALSTLDVLKENTKKAATKLTWECIEQDILPQTYKELTSVAFIGVGNLSKNNRTVRIGKSLLKQGITVKIIGNLPEDHEIPDDGITYISV